MRPLDRILNSKVKEKKFVGRIESKSGSKFVVATDAGRMQVDVMEGFTIGDNVVISGTLIIGKSGPLAKPKSVLV